MIRPPRSAYTTSDLRRSEVIDEALTHAVSVREGRTGQLLLLMPQAMVDRSNEVARYMQLFARLVVECQRDDPSSVSLEQIGFILDFTVEQRNRFIREFAEALSASISEDDPEAVEAFVRYARHASDPVPPQFHASFLDDEQQLLEAHIARR